MRIVALLLTLTGLLAGESSAVADGAACATVPLFENGSVARQVCGEQNNTGFTLLDLRDDWAPAIFAETSDRPQSYRRTFIALANEQIGQGREWGTARRDRYLELFGIFPSIAVVRTRLLDDVRHACHAGVDDAALRALKRPLAPWTFTAGPTRSKVEALTVVQRHLRCEGLLAAGAGDGSFDGPTQESLRVYQRRHMLPSAAVIDAETRDTLLTNSRELDFRTLLRALRERVVDATGLVEDGSALNAWEPILGRFIESAEYRRSIRPHPLDSGAPDLIDRATEAAAVALGWMSPESAARALVTVPPPLVAIRLPPPPTYHTKPMKLRAEIDRGDVWRSHPLDAQGRPRRSPVKARATFTLYAVAETGEIPLLRWPTTIGGWKQEMQDGSETLRYKESPVGRRYWRDLVAAPAWFPPASTPDRELVRRRPDGSWAADDDAVGPGYRSAYGLVALFHHRAVSGISGGAVEYTDAEIRTHGSGNYRSILRGSSHGCHRLFNHLALRLGSFVLAHTEHERHGLTDERYGRVIDWQGHTLRLRAKSRGYRYQLFPPIPVDVLDGRAVRSKAPPPSPGRAAPAAPSDSPPPSAAPAGPTAQRAPSARRCAG
jgi:hypothetical protein